MSGAKFQDPERIWLCQYSRCEPDSLIFIVTMPLCELIKKNLEVF